MSIEREIRIATLLFNIRKVLGPTFYIKAVDENEWIAATKNGTFGPAFAYEEDVAIYYYDKIKKESKT